MKANDKGEIWIPIWEKQMGSTTTIEGLGYWVNDVPNKKKDGPTKPDRWIVLKPRQQQGASPYSKLNSYGDRSQLPEDIPF